MNPLLKALRQLGGGSGSTDEIYERVVQIEQIPEAILEKLHDPERSNQTEVAYRLAWARTYLRKFGLLDNSSRGVWTLTNKAKDIESVDPQEVVRVVRAMDKEQGPQRPVRKKKETEEAGEEIPDEAQEWSFL